MIEIILVVSLVSLVGLAAFKTIANGLKIWEQSLQLGVEEDVAIFLDKLTNDLKNSFHFSLLTFEGYPNLIAFPTIVRTREDRKKHYGREEYVDQLGKVEYYFDSLKKAIYQRQANYSQACEEEYGKKRLLAKSIYSLEFTYHINLDGELVTRNKTDGRSPQALEVEIKFKETTGKLRTVRKFINIPVGKK